MTEIKFPPVGTIIAYLGIEPKGDAHQYFTKRCADYMDKYVPMEQGDLRTNVDIQTDRIEYYVPYAHAQYVGFTKGPVVNYTTPGTGPYWDQRMISVDGQTLVDEVAEYIRRKQ